MDSPLNLHMYDDNDFERLVYRSGNELAKEAVVRWMRERDNEDELNQEIVRLGGEVDQLHSENDDLTRENESLTELVKQLKSERQAHDDNEAGNT